MKHSTTALETIREAITTQAKKAIEALRQTYNERCEVTRSIEDKLMAGLELTPAATKRLITATIQGDHIDRRDFLSKSAQRELKKIQEMAKDSTNRWYEDYKAKCAEVNQRVDVVMSRICLANDTVGTRLFDIALKHDFNKDIK